MGAVANIYGRYYYLIYMLMLNVIASPKIPLTALRLYRPYRCIGNAHIFATIEYNMSFIIYFLETYVISRFWPSVKHQACYTNNGCTYILFFISYFQLLFLGPNALMPTGFPSSHAFLSRASPLIF